EASRIENESVRLANEQARTASEAERVKAENIRKQNESERVRNESSRSEAETLRQQKEAERQTAESARQQAETQRIANENERKAAESARQQAEASRQQAETARGNAEAKRADAETARQQAEAKREKNEEARKAFFAKVTEQINGKQDKLTFDTEPVEGSSNPVTSDGIFKALSKIDISIFVPVATLPTEDINPNKVYLVRDAEGENSNMFAEYIYVDGAWELIGRSKINLEDYYTKNEIDALLANIKVEGVLTEEDIATVNGQKLTNGGNILLSAETIALDKIPTEGSVNGVTSGGVVDYMKPIYGEEIDINPMLVVAEQGYRWHEGVKTANSAFSIYKPISLKKGDIVKWDCPSYGVKYDGMDFMGYMDGETYVPLVRLTEDLSSQYILQNDCDVIFCMKPRYMMTIKVTRNGKYEGEELTGLYRYDIELRGYTGKASIGDTFGWSFNWNTPNKSLVLKVKAGERYIVDTHTGGQDPVVLILDANDVILYIRQTNFFARNQEIEIPQGGVWLICQYNNNTTTDGAVYKRIAGNQNLTQPPIYDRIAPYPGKATLKKNVGEICTFELDSSWSNGYVVVIVSAGDEYSVTVDQAREPCYMILDASRRVLVSETFEHTHTCNAKITIPEGGMFLVVNHSSISPIIRQLKNNRTGILEYNAHKEGFLANMSRHITGDTTEPSTWTKRLCMAWTSDTHLDIIQYERFVQYVEANKAYIDAVLHTGDANRMADTDKGFEKTVMAYRPTLPMIFILGNHDTFGQSRSGDALSSGSLVWNGEHYTKPFLDENCAATSDNCTYYRDFPSQKVRVISINDYAITRYADSKYWVTTTDETEISNAVEWDADTSYAVDDIVLYKGLYLKCKTAGKLPDDAHTWPADSVPVNKYNMSGRYLPQEYVDFIINALNVEAGWSIILTAHQPFEKFTNQEIANEAWHTAPQSFNIPSASFSQNGYILQDILSAYIKRTTIEKTYSAVKKTDNPLAGTPINDAELLPDVTLAADFTLAKGSVIAFLHGHAHTDSCFYSAHMDDGIKLLCIGINTGCFCAMNEKDRWYSGDIVKGEDGTRDLFNIISFDTESKEIFLLRIGADITENFTERKFARIKYTT
ncbi:MAG: metallophosphoesterase, partial [Prevotella sp.]|nr:metallophosphoesterase [Prevotella sp.]